MSVPASFGSISGRTIRVIGVPLDLGQQRRGVDMGPSAVRVAGLESKLEALGHTVEDAGNIAVVLAEQKNPGELRARYLKEITATCKKHAALVVETLKEGAVPLSIGGNHSMAVGSVSGVAEFYRQQRQRVGLIWLDAHSDINTPDSTTSGNVHGMPLGAILGLGPKELADIYGWSPKVAPDNCVLVGLRDVDLPHQHAVVGRDLGRPAVDIGQLLGPQPQNGSQRHAMNVAADRAVGGGVDIGVCVQPDQPDALPPLAVKLGHPGDRADGHGVIAAESGAVQLPP